MGWFRITIARLLLIIAYCGIGFGALRSPSWIWASTLFSLVAASLAATTLFALYRSGTKRAFWVGFSLFGWLYLRLSSSPWSGPGLSPLIVTSALMNLAYSTISGTVPIGVTTQSVWKYWSEPPQNANPFNWVVPEPFRIICHAMLTPIFALLGGYLAQWLHRTRDQSDS